MEAAERLQQLGGVLVPIDFAAFAKTANLLYTSAFLAERYSGVRPFLEAGPVRACCSCQYALPHCQRVGNPLVWTVRTFAVLHAQVVRCQLLL
jgi:hypothetical protein